MLTRGTFVWPFVQHACEWPASPLLLRRGMYSVPTCYHVGITHEELMVWCMQLAKAIPAGTSLALLKQLAVDRFAFAPLMTFAFFFVTSVIKVGTHAH